jgi:hypothetical protein
MLRTSLILLISFIAIFNTAQAQTTEEITTSTTPITTAPAATTSVVTTPTPQRHVITTEVPAPKVTSTAPANYVNCFTVEAGWHADIWVPRHSICQYSNTPEGVAWVEGYWACTHYQADTGICNTWDWKEAHWVKVLDVY